MRFGTDRHGDGYLQSHINPELKREMRQEVARQGFAGYNVLLERMWEAYVERVNSLPAESAESVA